MKPFLQVKINSINQAVLTVYAIFLSKIFKKLSIKYSLTHLPINNKRITLLKSPHVHKSSREQFEVKTYKLVITVFSSVPTSLLQFLILNKPKSLKVKVTKN